MNGKVVREKYPVGTTVMFKPKGLISDNSLIGVVKGHMYVDVLTIDSGGMVWSVSVKRVSIIDDSFDDDQYPFEDDFQPCDKCDLPDSCSDFGCAIKAGLYKPVEF